METSYSRGNQIDSIRAGIHTGIATIAWRVCSLISEWYVVLRTSFAHRHASMTERRVQLERQVQKCIAHLFGCEFQDSLLVRWSGDHRTIVRHMFVN